MVSGNIPIWGPDGTSSNTIPGAKAAAFITKISDVYNNYYTGGEKRDERKYVSSDWSQGSLQLMFVGEVDSFVTGSNGNFTVK
jgi:hypothetical protein